MASKVLYDSFNARYLTFQQVADSFIKNDYFDQLFHNSHSLLMGPRGCGKTTLLKMLTPPALTVWDRKQKTNLLREIPFYAIYVPTDIHWKKQLDQLKNDISDVEIVKSFSRATVNVNILVAVIKTFSFLSNELDLDEDKSIELEVKLCKILIDGWKLKKPITPTLDSIELSLLSEISNINSQIRRLKTDKKFDFDYQEINFLHYFDLVIFGCTAFEKTYNFSTKKWALCFDELEIAPEWLQLELLQYLRSREQRLIFKLTTAPIVSLFREIKEELWVNSSENHDFSVVRVWTSNQKEFRTWKVFCNQLIRSRISRKFSHSIIPEKILGKSNLEYLITPGKNHILESSDATSFEKNSFMWSVIKDLAEIDHSFKAFLITKKIDPKNPVPVRIKQKDEVFRKIKQIVIYRYQFWKDGPQKRRSRKVIPLYFGVPLIYELCDGNPRILIGMIDELLNLATLPNGQIKTLTINEQSRVLTEISKKYLAVISSHPDANVIINDKPVNLSNVLRQIGTYFYEKIAIDNFTMDPPGTFRVNEDINNKLIELLELALYLGAIVYVDDNDVLAKSGVLNKKFRLSYILSPYFNLLSREYSEVKLSTIINKKASFENQPSLFDQ